MIKSHSVNKRACVFCGCPVDNRTNRKGRQTSARGKRQRWAHDDCQGKHDRYKRSRAKAYQKVFAAILSRVSRNLKGGASCD